MATVTVKFVMLSVKKMKHDGFGGRDENDGPVAAAARQATLDRQEQTGRDPRRVLLAFQLV